MHCAVQSSFLCNHSFRRDYRVTGIQAAKKLTESDWRARRRRSLKRFDGELRKGDFVSALSLLKQLQGKPGGLCGFGAVKLVPKRVSLLDESELSLLQSSADSVVDSIKRCIQFSQRDEFTSQASTGRVENLIDHDVDAVSQTQCEDDHFMCMQHEAGHFLVGYLLGVLPKGYEVPTIEAIMLDGFKGGRVEFMGFDFITEVPTAEILRKSANNGELCNRASKGTLSSTTLNKFSCTIIGGLVAEHLVIGYTEGLHSDVNKLERVLKWLGFTVTEFESHVKWAALNTVAILHQHREARSRLAEAMARGKSVGFCIDAIENSMRYHDIL